MQPLIFAFFMSVFLVPVYDSSAMRNNVFKSIGWYCWSFRNHGLVSIAYYLWTLYYKSHSVVCVAVPLNISIVFYLQMLSPAREFKWTDTDSTFTNVRQAMKEDLLKSASNPMYKSSNFYQFANSFMRPQHVKTFSYAVVKFLHDNHMIVPTLHQVVTHLSKAPHTHDSSMENFVANLDRFNSMSIAQSRLNETLTNEEERTAAQGQHNNTVRMIQAVSAANLQELASDIRSFHEARLSIATNAVSASDASDRFLFTPQPNRRSTMIGRPREVSDELIRAPIFSEVPALDLAILFSDSSPSFEHVHEEVKFGIPLSKNSKTNTISSQHGRMHICLLVILARILFH